jgi:signal peptidase I
VDIDFDTGEVRVDGELLHEDYIAATTHRYYDVTFPQTVPEGCVFVMGDNRNASNDSRNSELGMVDRRCIMGKAYMILLPFSKIRFLG